FTDICTVARCGPNSVSGSPAEPLPYSQPEFGGAVGGPIFKKKTFFSAGYEGWRYSAPVGSFQAVPTDAELGGDFSNSLIGRTVGGVFTPNAIYNPYSPGGATRFQCDGSGAPITPNLT